MILISLLITGWFEFSFYSFPVLAFVFPESYPIHPNVQIYWCFITFVQDTVSLLFKNLLSVIFLFHSVLFYYILFFFSNSLARGLSVLLIFSQDLHSALLSFCDFFILICYLFISALISIISFFCFSLTLS